MNIRNIILLAVALLIAGGTAMFAREWASGARAVTAAPPAPPPSARVLVAAKSLAVGQFVRAKDLKWQIWPKDGVAKIYAVKGKNKIDEFVGAVARSTIAAGQPITQLRVVHPGDRGFLAAVLNPGTRAVSVPVNATTGISGFIFPGDRVDVLVTIKFRGKDAAGDNRTRYFSETLLSGVRVLAIDQETENENGKVKLGKTVTLEVTPKRAEKVAIALEMGSISLSLNSLTRRQDGEPDAPATASTAASDRARTYTMDSDVFIALGNQVSAPTARPARVIKVLRGGKSEDVTAGGKSGGAS